MEFNINKSCFDMELMESSFDLMQNPCSHFKESFLDDAYPFVLTDAVVIKQKIKPTIIVR
jgi:hypothetical protein